MNTSFMGASRCVAALAAAAALLGDSLQARAQESVTEPAEAHVIPVETGTSAFAPGDSITITNLRSDGAHMNGSELELKAATPWRRKQRRPCCSPARRGKKGNRPPSGPTRE